MIYKALEVIQIFLAEERTDLKTGIFFVMEASAAVVSIAKEFQAFCLFHYLRFSRRRPSFCWVLLWPVVRV